MVKNINTAKYLYLDKISEENELELRIYVNEAVSDSSQCETVEGIEGCFPIITNETCARYELVFENYVGYSVRNESYTSMDSKEKFKGNLFRLYTNSRFLDYIRSSSIAPDVLATRLKHYEIVCLSHVIDVATEHIPAIS